MRANHLLRTRYGEYVEVRFETLGLCRHGIQLRVSQEQREEVRNVYERVKPTKYKAVNTTNELSKNNAGNGIRGRALQGRTPPEREIQKHREIQKRVTTSNLRSCTTLADARAPPTPSERRATQRAGLHRVFHT